MAGFSDETAMTIPTIRMKGDKQVQGMSYDDFLCSKGKVKLGAGIDVDTDAVHPKLFPFQRDIVRWALRNGRAAVFADTGLGKAQPVDEPVLTPHGWRRIGELQVGDALIGGDGQETVVTGVFPQGIRPVVQVEFNDGARTEADWEHLWTVTTDLRESRGQLWQVHTTRELALTLRQPDGRLRWRVPTVSVQLMDLVLPLNPYVLGILLGDGCLTGTLTVPMFTTADEEIVKRVNERLDPFYAARKAVYSNCCPTYRITRVRGIGVGSSASAILKALRTLGLWGCSSLNKFIPSLYLYASKRQRLDLLHGLMDSDGWTGECTQFTSVSHQLALDVQTLVRSLGGVARLTSKIPTFSDSCGKRKNGQRAYTVTVKLPVGVIPFALSRKVDKYRLVEHTPPVRKIKSIELLGNKEVICIQVAAPHQTYVTRDYVVTHNTFIQLEWSRLIGCKTLIIAPLSVAKQTIREAQKIDIEVKYARSQADVSTSQLSITNYEMVDRFDLTAFGAVVLDECFSPDTPVEVFNIDKSLELRYIKDVREGDLIYNAQGEDYVKAVCKRQVKRAVHIAVNGRTITCSENHPFFTMYGWRCAQDLRAGDYLMETKAAMCLVRDGVLPNLYLPERAKVLRAVLLSEMENEYARTQSEGSYERNTCSDRPESQYVEARRQLNRKEGNGKNNQSEPNEPPRSQREGFAEIARNEAQAFRARGKREGINDPSKNPIGSPWRELDSGISPIAGAANSWLSYCLQTRPSESREKNCHRGRRFLPLQPEAIGCEEGYKVGFARVDSVEILEQGHPSLEKYRDGEGHIYFYDIKATRHPSFSVSGLLVHNSSILKSLDGKTRRKLTKLCSEIPYRLCCTATPAPNDFTELGNHAEFLGICSQAEMLATFFINANKQRVYIIDDRVYERKGSNNGGQEWRLKHHAEEPFFQWLSSWAISLITPSDLGYSDDGFILPPLNINPIFVQSNYVPAGQLFFTGLHGITDRVHVRRQTIVARLGRLESLVADDSGQWVIWCGLDKEQEAIAEMLGDRCISVYGSLSAEEKETRIERWLDGEAQIIVSKAKILGHGMNFQNAHNALFFGISDSWEMFYQCIRREWRYGQVSPVNVYVILSDAESEVYLNVLRKDALAKRLRQGLISSMREFEKEELGLTEEKDEVYLEDRASGKHWELLLGDSCKRLKEIEPESIDLSIYSPPFADLYVYSQSERDLGNSRGWGEFFEHYAYIIKEVLRVTKPGRLTCVHSSDIPAMLSRDGWIGLKDFPGEVIRAYEKQGWVFIGRAFVQKNPQAQAVRTKSKALLFVQLRKDSTDSRPALIDQILLFRKPGDNAVPVNPVANGELTNDIWIEWAHGIWLGISESNTLNYTRARDAEDEKHICPLQLGTIERCIKLYSNPGELVLDPFSGIGSTGYEAVRLDRRFVGIELKPSYYKMAKSNLQEAESFGVGQGMFRSSTL